MTLPPSPDDVGRAPAPSAPRPDRSALDAPLRLAPDPWAAPAATGPVRGVVEVPGSKSLTNRWLVLAAVADGPSVLHGALDSRDTRLMRAALAALGARFEDGPGGSLAVTPLPVGVPLPKPVTVDCGLAGTVMRFVPAVAALRPGVVHLDGDAGARVRPMAPLVAALRQCGARVEERGEPGLLPLTVTTPPTAETAGVAGGSPAADAPAEVAVDSSASSQFLSALLLTAARRPQGLVLRHTGSAVPSPEHVAMTVGLLRERGVRVDVPEPGLWRVHPGPLPGFEARVEPDLSNAGPFLAAAAVTGGRVSVPGWPLETTQIGDRWRTILPAFGAAVELVPDPAEPGSGVLTVTGGTSPAPPTGPEKGGDDPSSTPAAVPLVTGAGEVADTAELAPTVAALALLADGPTRLTGIGHLRGHETDRLAALTAEAARFGVPVAEGAAELGFPGTAAAGAPRAAVAETYHDHRMATFAAVVGLRAPGTRVVDVATTDKTLPGFAARWEALVAGGPRHEEEH